MYYNDLSNFGYTLCAHLNNFHQNNRLFPSCFDVFNKIESCIKKATSYEVASYFLESNRLFS